MKVIFIKDSGEILLVSIRAQSLVSKRVRINMLNLGWRGHSCKNAATRN